MKFDLTKKLAEMKETGKSFWNSKMGEHPYRNGSIVVVILLAMTLMFNVMANPGNIAQVADKAGVDVEFTSAMMPQADMNWVTQNAQFSKGYVIFTPFWSCKSKTAQFMIMNDRRVHMYLAAGLEKLAKGRAQKLYAQYTSN